MALTPSAAQLDDALSHFDELLRRDSREVEFQRLFTACPYILSRSLPLSVAPSEIVPLGRPGISEPDFVAVPTVLTPLSSYGIIELKRPNSPILSRPRKGILTLSRAAQTAVAQGEVYGNSLFTHSDIVDPGQVLALGNQRYLIVIMGLSSELTEKLKEEIYAEQAKGLLPQNCRLVPYDTLFRSFQNSIPARLVLLVPNDIYEKHSGLAFRHHERNGRHTFEFMGELDMASVGHMDTAITPYLTSRTRGIFLDLEGITFIDSAAIRVPLRLNERCTQESIEFFILVGRSQQVKRLLSITGVAESLPLVDSKPPGY